MSARGGLLAACILVAIVASWAVDDGVPERASVVAQPVATATWSLPTWEAGARSCATQVAVLAPTVRACLATSEPGEPARFPLVVRHR